MKNNKPVGTILLVMLLASAALKENLDFLKQVGTKALV